MQLLYYMYFNTRYYSALTVGFIRYAPTINDNQTHVLLDRDSHRFANPTPPKFEGQRLRILHVSACDGDENES